MEQLTRIARFVVPALVVAVLATFAVVALSGEERKTLVAHFPRTISVYEGSDVRVLGVPVGTVERVEPSGTDVEVTMSYDASTQVPADAKAVVVAPAIVGDRYVQLTPAFTGGEVLADGAELDLDRTAVPLELDQIYRNLDQLTVALGPTGANKEGALTDLLDETARNFGGQGESVRRTITNFSRLSSTLDGNSDELFGSAARLHAFVETLARNDRTVRRFNRSMAQVSTMLAGERDDLSRALANLATAMTQVSGFVRDNEELLGRNIKGLNRVSKVLVHQRAALEEILRIGPLALNNLALTYNPQAGTLDTRANIGELLHQVTADPATLLCGMVNQVERPGRICKLIQQALPRAAAGRASGDRSAGPASGPASGPVSDPTLGGLVDGGAR